MQRNGAQPLSGENALSLSLNHRTDKNVGISYYCEMVSLNCFNDVKTICIPCILFLAKFFGLFHILFLTRKTLYKYFFLFFHRLLLLILF